MENQTRFDLKATIQNWQQELAAQSNLTPEVRRELETHLRDSIADLRQRGLNDEESFWLARRRVGHPQQLGEDFAKVDPANGWRERIFWKAFVILLFPMWLISSMAYREWWASLSYLPQNAGELAGLLLLTLVIVWPFFCMGVLLTKIRTLRWCSALRSRWLLAFMAVTFTAITYSQTFQAMIIGLISVSLLLGLVALFIWLLMPTRMQTKLKRIFNRQVAKET
jgi:hypothetical protein